MTEPGAVKTARWREIRRAALDLFEDHGFAGVSVDEIAEAAGVSRRTFFNYFDSKAAAVFDPDPEERRGLTRLLGSAPRTDDGWTVLTTSVRDYVLSQGPVVRARRLLIRRDPALERSHHMANTHFGTAIRQWLAEQAVEPYRARIISSVALAVVREAFLAWEPEDGMEAFAGLMDEGFRAAVGLSFPVAGAGCASPSRPVRGATVARTA
ncbi:helix-turn-helix domain-containing protein [Streptomyces sp. NPDC048106]|uniref:TetR/AcrR family transcriptional regulator n=1 Tax=Streptomyces sp. NPDC048106 TaxID=3155750 RepID=UPI0034546E03